MCRYVCIVMGLLCCLCGCMFSVCSKPERSNSSIRRAKEQF